jgi:hypothetical protein
MEGTIESDRMIIYYELVYVLKEVRKEIIKQAYNITTSGHFGIEKTMERVMRTYYWLGM